MPFAESSVGKSTEPVEVSWSWKDAILYAVGVGAGADDPQLELEYTTQNTDGIIQRVLGSYCVVLAQTANPFELAGSVDLHHLVHGEQEFLLHKPIPTEGSVSLVATLDAIYDKGSAALVVSTVTAKEPDGDTLFTAKASYVVKGERGFGKQPKPTTPWTIPDRDPDASIEQTVRSDQALIYRLSGDFNPLHSDPRFATDAGFPRPILHGLATQGFAFRALGMAVAEGDPTRIVGMGVRFSRPVFPGTSLRTDVWVDGSDVVFRTLDSSGEVVLDRGVATLGVTA